MPRRSQLIIARLAEEQPEPIEEIPAVQEPETDYDFIPNEDLD